MWNLSSMLVHRQGFTRSSFCRSLVDVEVKKNDPVTPEESSAPPKSAGMLPKSEFTDEVIQRDKTADGKHRLSTAFMLTVNVLLALLIVVFNKYVYVNFKFPNVTMTLIHFTITFAGLAICRLTGLIQVKPMSLKDITPLSFLFCAYGVLPNLSLEYNTVGTCMILKLITLPTVMVIQTYAYKKIFSTNIKLSLVPVICGVLLNSIGDIRFNVIGTTYGVAGALLTALYQVWVCEKQKEFKIDSMQLLYHQTSVAVGMLVFVVAVVEPPWQRNGVFTQSWTKGKLFMVTMSGIFGFFINVTMYWIIRNTSPLTYNIVGQVKFCTILIAGYLLFSETLEPMQSVGLYSTLLGASMYTYFKILDERVGR